MTSKTTTTTVTTQISSSSTGSGCFLNGVHEEDNEEDEESSSLSMSLPASNTKTAMTMMACKNHVLAGEKTTRRPLMPISGSESSFRNLSNSSLISNNHILPNKISLKSVTVDSSKDYSTSSSSEESTDIMAIGTSLSSPTASEQAFHHHNHHNHHHNHQSNPNNHHNMFKQLSKSVSIDEQSSNGIMMIAPLTLNHHNGDEEPSSSSLSSTYGGVGVRSSSSELEPVVPFSKQPSSSSSSNDTKSSPQIIDASTIHLLDFSMFDLIDKTSRKFVLKPATVGLQIKCQIYRQKGILYPEYKFYLENLDTNLLLLMTARKKMKSKTACYIISSITFDLNDLEKYIETPIAKLKSNLLGTNFSLYDFGTKPARRPKLQQKQTSYSASNTYDPIASNNVSTSSLPKSDTGSLTAIQKNSSIDHGSDTNTSDEMTAYRKEYVSVNYEINVLGVKGPRQMCIILPGMDDKLNREEFIQTHSSETLIQSWKRIESNLKQTQLQISPLSSQKDNNITQQTPIINESTNNNNSNKQSKLSSIRRHLFQLSRTQSIDKSRLSVAEELPSGGVLAATTSVGGNTTTTTTATTKKQSDLKNVVKLVNKSPEWHKELHSFALDFHGRVTMPSVKNFQICHEINTDYVVMQFGKVNKDLYTCDYSYPMCALQAFAIALTSLDNKLGCD